MAGGPGAPERGAVSRARTGSPCSRCSTARSRAITGLERPARAQGAVYLVCSHGDVIKSIIADSLGLHLDMCQRIQVDPCSLSVIRYTPLRPFLLRMNDTGAAVPASRGRSRAARASGTRRGRRGHWRRSGRIRVMPVYSYDPPERFVAGTVGQPGERTFYLQATSARPGHQRRAREIPGEPAGRAAGRAARRGAAAHRRADVGARRRAGRLADDGPLDLPLIEDFRVGAIALAWDGEDERVVIEAQEESETPGRAAGRRRARERPGRAAGADHRRRGTGVLPARAADRRQGRPPCPLCGLPLDADGHICPRQNGHRVSNG